MRRLGIVRLFVSYLHVQNKFKIKIKSEKYYFFGSKQTKTQVFGYKCKRKSSSMNHKTGVHEKKKTSSEIISPQCVHHNSVEKKITNSKHCTSDLLADRQA